MELVILILKILGILILIPVIVFVLMLSIFGTIQIVRGAIKAINEDIKGEKK